MIIFDALALIAAMQYVAYRFLQSTMFSFIYSEPYKYVTFISLVAIGGARLSCMFIQRMHQWKKYATFRYAGKCLLFIFVSAVFAYVGVKNDYKFWVFVPIVAVCLYGIDPEKVFLWFVNVELVLLMGTVLCCLAGTVRNLIYVQENHVIGSYGIVNTTDLAAYCTFLLLFGWCKQKGRGLGACVEMAAIDMLVTMAAYWFTGSRTALYCGLMLLALIFWEGIKNGHSQSKLITTIDNNLKRFAIISFPLMTGIVLILTFLYSKGIPWTYALNELFSDRIRYTLQVYEQYGMKPFGTVLTGMHGYGGTILRDVWTGNVPYIDIGYAMLAIRYGWVMFLAIMGIWVWMTAHMFKCGRDRIAFSLAIIAFHAFSEARFLDVNYNILMVMPLCLLCLPRDSHAGKDTRGFTNNKKGALLYALLCLIGLAVVIAMPRIVSWLRTIFSVLGWNRGTGSRRALLTGVLLVCSIAALLKSIALLWCHRNKASIAAVCGSLLLIAFGVIAGNRIIQISMREQASRLESEEGIVRIVQEAATQPVYVAEQSEIYQRRFGGFSDHVFSSEELYQAPQGTLFTDKSTEVLGITRTGGKYLQFSDWSGIYSYDQAVIDALENKGYEWYAYYTSEREIDLADLASKNGLVRDDIGRVRISGSHHGIEENEGIDQQFGIYTVKLCLELDEYQITPLKKPEKRHILSNDRMETDSGSKGIICVFRIMGEKGKRVIQDNPIMLSDFDENGRCEKSFTYEIMSTPKVTYLLSARDGVSLYLDEISWKKDPLDEVYSTEVYLEEKPFETEGTKVDFESPEITLSNAVIVEDQYQGKQGIHCKGSLQRDWHVKEVTAGDYMRDTDYVGFKWEIESIDDISYITFVGRKYANHGQPTVCVYNEMGEVVGQFRDRYDCLNRVWHQYILDVSKLRGKATVIFNGGYVDSTGSDNSQYIFCDLRYY